MHKKRPAVLADKIPHGSSIEDIKRIRQTLYDTDDDILTIQTKLTGQWKDVKDLLKKARQHIAADVDTIDMYVQRQEKKVFS